MTRARNTEIIAVKTRSAARTSIVATRTNIVATKTEVRRTRKRIEEIGTKTSKEVATIRNLLKKKTKIGNIKAQRIKTTSLKTGIRIKKGIRIDIGAIRTSIAAVNTPVLLKIKIKIGE